MEFGRKIYFEKTSGVIVIIIPERTGDVIQTTFEEDKLIIPLLTLFTEAELGVKQLAYGELSPEFVASRGARINPITLEIEFAM